MICKECGKEIKNPNASFCPNCGKRLAAAEINMPNKASAPKKKPPRRSYTSKPTWDKYQDPNRWLKWAILFVVIVVAIVAGIVVWSIGTLDGESPLNLGEKPGQGDLSDEASSKSLFDSEPENIFSSSEPVPTPQPSVEPAQPSDTQVVFRNARPGGVITVNGVQVPFTYVGTDAVVERAYLPDVAQVRIVAPGENQGWQTAAVWYNYRYGNDITFGDAANYGEYRSCEADGKAEPSVKMVDVLTWAYYDGFLQCINEQTLDYMIYSTLSNTNDQSANIYGTVNAQNTYDRGDFNAVCDPDSISYENGRVLYNGYFHCYATNRTTGQTVDVVNHRTIELVWEDGLWKVNRIAFLSDDDFNAKRYADLS